MTIILLLTKNIKGYKYESIFYLLAFIIGIAQIFAIIPGISRSGITISIAILLGLNKNMATKFSFLLAIPILLFSFIQSIYINYLSIISSELFWYLVVGFFSSFIIGYIAIGILVNLVNKHKMWYFSIYCFSLAVFVVYNYGL